MAAARFSTGGVFYAGWFPCVFPVPPIAFSARSCRWLEVPARRWLRAIGSPLRPARI